LTGSGDCIGGILLAGGHRSILVKDITGPDMMQGVMARLFGLEKARSFSLISRSAALNATVEIACVISPLLACIAYLAEPA
jgi:hypothetical protein